MRCASRIAFVLVWVVGCGEGGSAGSGGDESDGGESDWAEDLCGFDQWELAAPMLGNRSFHAITLLPDGTVLATGGHAYLESYEHTSAERYDPETDVWTLVADMPVARVGHGQVVVEDGTVLVIAGNADANDRVDRYDPSLDEWSPSTSLPIEIGGTQAFAAIDNGVFVASDEGFLRSEDGGVSWSVIAEPPDAYRLADGAFRWDDDTFVIPGAVPADGGRPVQLYRWSTDSWEQVPSVDPGGISIPGYLNACGPLSASRLLVVMTTAGLHGRDGYPQEGISLEFDVGGEDWHSWAGAHFYTDTVRVAALPYRSGWLWAGDGSDAGHVYEDASNRWCRTAMPEHMDSYGRATLLADGRILLTGGEIEVDGATRTIAQIWSHPD